MFEFLWPFFLDILVLFHMLYSSSNKILMCFYKIAFIFNEQSVFFISFINKKKTTEALFLFWLTGHFLWPDVFTARVMLDWIAVHWGCYCLQTTYLGLTCSLSSWELHLVFMYFYNLTFCTWELHRSCCRLCTSCWNAFIKWKATGRGWDSKNFM